MKKLRQLLSIMTVVVFLIALLSAFIPVSAVQVPETLKIYVGYWGGPYAVKAEFTRDQLKRMTQYESYYTYITRVGTVKLQYAKGPTLKTILNASGIDINSIRQFDFYTVDSEAKFLSKGRSELLDTTRYYYPNLRANGYTDSNNQEWVVTDPAAAKIGAKVVPVIIATDECSTNHPAETPLPSQMTSAESFRLCSGQTDLTSVTSFESAKWIHAIYVVLSGSPPEGIKINEGDLLNLKVGSTQKLTYTLLGNDIADSEKNVTWQSSNPNIIKVDNQGRITVLAQGEAVITATTSNGKTASIKINAAIMALYKTRHL
ncbi:MAG: Ig-like domain-containing protein [Oscillospiraceae bacterium]|nr:Ig-like domain-containing protein [Oscillospiraceae bacterium]